MPAAEYGNYISRIQFPLLSKDAEEWLTERRLSTFSRRVLLRNLQIYRSVINDRLSLDQAEQMYALSKVTIKVAIKNLGDAIKKHQEVRRDH